MPAPAHTPSAFRRSIRSQDNSGAEDGAGRWFFFNHRSGNPQST
jgi:hypothetical protein